MSEQVTPTEAQAQAQARPDPPDGWPPGGDDPAEEERRPDVPPALRRLAAWSWRLLVILTAAGLLLYLLILLKVIVVPVIVALFLATLLVPMVSWLERRGWRHLLAVLAVFLGTLLALAAIVAGFIPLIGNELDDLRRRADEGVQEVQRFIASRPFGLTEEDINRFLEQARERFTENSTGLTRSAVAGVTLVGEVITGLILALFLTFFFVKDSERFTRWILDFVGPARAGHLREVGRRSATAVSGYLRGQATVGLVDGVFIGIGLAIVGVPLVVPLAFLTFVAAFLPLVGAVVAGALAALVALVTKGLTAALIVVGITLLVQQLEGHLLAPLLLGRAVALHPVVIILALAAGSILGGIIGAFLAVPIAAVLTAVGTYLRGEPVGEPADAGEPEPETSGRG
ncbi:MAG TPA: AI-2E family transporter [Actinomycetes bacterium]|jgi:predicted PurR-regulated permease PerM|nr:AI-2E family transporter [Actinomycetes bacterium]